MLIVNGEASATVWLGGLDTICWCVDIKESIKYTGWGDQVHLKMSFSEHKEGPGCLFRWLKESLTSISPGSENDGSPRQRWKQCDGVFAFDFASHFLKNSELFSFKGLIFYTKPVFYLKCWSIRWYIWCLQCGFTSRLSGSSLELSNRSVSDFIEIQQFSGKHSVKLEPVKWVLAGQAWGMTAASYCIVVTDLL